MILYLDASALVKRYVDEPGSAEVVEMIAGAESVATTTISRAEVSAVLARAERLGALTLDDALTALAEFRREWAHFMRIPLTEGVVAMADAATWEYGLRGYDAVQLATAAAWQEAIGESIALVTFDRQLWVAAGRAGLLALPAGLVD